MSLRYINNKLNCVLRTTQPDVKLHANVTNMLQQQVARFYNEGQGGTTAEVDAAAAHPPLVDLHGRRHDYLRISLTERCNLRCKYCMPAEGVTLSARAALLSREELARLVRLFAGLGVRKVRLTGGEPTLRPDLADLVQEMSAVAGISTVAMTTNGLVLTRRLPALQRAGLTHLNVSLDSLQPHRYEAMARRPGLPRVLAGLDLALQLGYRPKVNVVLIKGFNDDEIGDFVEYTRERDLEVRFIEYMPFGGNRWSESRLVPHAAAVAAARHLAAPHDTARVWRAPGHAGRVGFVSSLTRPFCAGCNRLRLTADGSLKVCLFGRAEVSLRDALRAGAADGELRDLVRDALRRKLPQHAGAGPPLTRAPVGRHAAARAPGQPAHDPHRWVAWGGVGRVGRAVAVAVARGMCSLPHVDGAGGARMVDVGDKPVTSRTAEAECRLEAGRGVLALLAAGRLPKGDALGVARVAGLQACKRAADLLPLCHPLPLDAARVRLALEAGGVRVTCAVRATARTGAEMEALTGCAVAALALYDMCKAVDKDMRVTGLRLLSKTGGRSDWPHPRPDTPPSQSPPSPSQSPPSPSQSPPSPSQSPPSQSQSPPRSPSTEPAAATETYAPTNFMNF